MNNWDKNTYQRIEQVKLLNDSLEVSFENGDNIKILLKSILPVSFDESRLEMTFGSYEIILKSKDQTIEVPRGQNKSVN